jgi:hypothetical protein
MHASPLLQFHFLPAPLQLLRNQPFSTMSIAKYPQRTLSHTGRLDILEQLTNDHRAYLHLIYENANPSQKTTRYTGDVPSPPESIKKLTVRFLVAFTNKDKPKSLVTIEHYIQGLT